MKSPPKKVLSDTKHKEHRNPYYNTLHEHPLDRLDTLEDRIKHLEDRINQLEKEGQ